MCGLYCYGQFRGGPGDVTSGKWSEETERHGVLQLGIPDFVDVRDWWTEGQPNRLPSAVVPPFSSTSKGCGKGREHEIELTSTKRYRRRERSPGEEMSTSRVTWGTGKTRSSRCRRTSRIGDPRSCRDNRRNWNGCEGFTREITSEINSVDSL